MSRECIHQKAYIYLLSCTICNMSPCAQSLIPLMRSYLSRKDILPVRNHSFLSRSYLSCAKIFRVPFSSANVRVAA